METDLVIWGVGTIFAAAFVYRYLGSFVGELFSRRNDFESRTERVERSRFILWSWKRDTPEGRLSWILAYIAAVVIITVTIYVIATAFVFG